MAIKTGKDEIYFEYFQRIYETLEKDPLTSTSKPIENLSYTNTSRKEKEFGSYINRFINNKLTKNGN